MGELERRPNKNILKVESIRTSGNQLSKPGEGES